MGHSASYYWKEKIPEAQFFAAVPFGLSTQEMNGWLHYGGGIALWRELYEPHGVIPFAMGNSLVPKLMFILLPIFALQLKLTYLFSKRLYVEHLIQTLHTHCFIFIFFMIIDLPEAFAEYYSAHIEFGSSLITGLMDFIDIILVIYFFYYLYKTLRVVYQQSRKLTILKFFINSMLYFSLLILMIPVGFIWHAF